MKNKKSIKKITFVDLFSGIGGFHLGIKQAAKNKKLAAECLVAVDINQKARDTYSLNFSGTKLLNDITDPSVKDYLPDDADIICGGFPCQPFSLAGKKLGTNDDRGTLFHHIVEILKKKRPKAVFLENVRNLQNIKNEDGKFVIDEIKKAIKKAGYVIPEFENDDNLQTHKIFKATDFGLPTHRPRIYIVAFRADVFNGKKFTWPDPTHPEGMRLDSYFKNLDDRWSGKINRHGWPSRVGNTIRVGGAGSGFRDGNSRRDRRNWDSYMFNDGSIHTLSVDEAKAMMGFPPDFKFVVSDTHAMRQLGNSVAVPVIQAIANNIIETIYGGSHLA